MLCVSAFLETGLFFQKNTKMFKLQRRMSCVIWLADLDVWYVILNKLCGSQVSLYSWEKWHWWSISGISHDINTFISNWIPITLEWQDSGNISRWSGFSTKKFFKLLWTFKYCNNRFNYSADRSVGPVFFSSNVCNRVVCCLVFIAHKKSVVCLCALQDTRRIGKRTHTMFTDVSSGEVGGFAKWETKTQKKNKSCLFSSISRSS